MSPNAFIVMLLAVSSSLGGISEDEDFLWLDDSREKLYFVSESQLARSSIDSLPISDFCKETLRGRQSLARVQPVVPRSAPQAERRLAPPDATARPIRKAIAEWPEIFVTSVTRVEDGYRCWPTDVAKRFDLRVEDVVKGSLAEGEQVAIVLEGGEFHVEGILIVDDVQSYFSEPMQGDRVLVAGRRLGGSPTTSVEVGLNLRIRENEVERVDHPRFLERGFADWSSLRSLLAGSKE